MNEKAGYHDDYWRVSSVEPGEVAASASFVEAVRSIVAGEFFDNAKTRVRQIDEYSDKTIGSIGGGRMPGDMESPTVFAGASLEHFNNCWRLVVLRTITNDSLLSRVAVRYFIESDGENVFEAKSQARVMRGSREITADEEELVERVEYSRCEYEKPLDDADCLRLQRQLARAISRSKVLGGRKHGLQHNHKT